MNTPQILMLFQTVGFQVKRMPYVLHIIDNWDHHEGRGTDLASYDAAEEVVAAARQVIDRSLHSIWKSIVVDLGTATAEHLFSRWMSFGDNTYIFATGVPPVEPRFDQYEYALTKAKTIAAADDNQKSK